VDTAKLWHASDADVLRAIKKVDTLYFKPGLAFRYSNTGYCILAMIIEKVSGLSYSAFMRQQIFNPLGMRQTAVWSPLMSLDKKATGYRFDSLGQRFVKDDADQGIFFSTEGDGGIYTSVHDYYHLWCQSLYMRSSMKDSAMLKAWSPQVPLGPPSSLSYGYGWFVDTSGGEKIVLHTGTNGGFHAVVYWVPSSQSLIVIFANRSDLDVGQLAGQIGKVCGFPPTSFE
jgi:CubicO group peptidase (beta-lactamase class C family)